MSELDTKKLESFQSENDKTGIIYLSRLPPFMTPQKLRTMLEKLGKIHRVYLEPESLSQTQKRKKSGGSSKQQFVRAWVEYRNKHDAVSASLLNGTLIGGKKSSRIHDDLWCIKYLPEFKWHHLTREISDRNAEREQKVREMRIKSKKETNEILKNAELAKKLEAIEEKKRKSGKLVEKEFDMKELAKRFKQRKLVE